MYEFQIGGKGPNDVSYTKTKVKTKIRTQKAPSEILSYLEL